MARIKKQMLRSTALAITTAILASLTASPAHAAIVNSVTNIQAAPMGGACRVSWNLNATGQVGDDPIIDFFLQRITDQAGAQVPVVPGITQIRNIGVTATTNQFIDITIAPGTLRYDKYINYTDFGGSGSGLLLQTIIPDNVLQAAGGACLNLIANNAPTGNAGPDASTNGLGSVSLSGTASDIENDPLTYQWTQTAGTAVTLTGATSLNPSFTAPPKAITPQILTFSLVVNDGMDNSTPDTVDITVNGNLGPTANAGPDATIGGGSTGTLDGSASTDGDGDPLTYTWTQTGGPAVTLSGANTPNPTFTAPAATTANQILIFELVVNDGLISSAADTVEITVPDNAAPVVNAGPDASAIGGSGVSLSGSATDLENDPLTYLWTQTAGPVVTLSGATTLTPNFIAPTKTNAAQILTFSLIANDGNSSSTADSVDITIPANVAPLGGGTSSVTLNGGQQTTFNASATTSDPDGDPLTIQWVQTSGPVAALTGTNSTILGITAPSQTAVVQTMTFEMVANDGLANSPPFLLTVSIRANVAPIADAGVDTSVSGGSMDTLDGSGSTDGDGDPLTYVWTQTSGPTVTLSGANTATPSFTAPASTAVNQTLTFSLVVSDGIVSSAADSVVITVPSNALPIVDAGMDATVAGGTNVALAGSASDPEMDPLTYIWTQTAGPSVTLSGATTLAPSFTAPPKTAAAQILTFSLVANDGISNSAPDTVDVTILANAGPTANAGADANVSGGASVTLDGSASLDGDGDTLTYNWSQTGGPIVTLSSASAASPTFTAPAATVLAQPITFDLVVSDGIATSAADSVVITVAANAPPVADAGVDQGPINSGDTVTLDGTASADPDGDPLIYTWTQISGTPVSLTGGSSATPTFVAPSVSGNEDLVFNLVVSDGQAISQADTVTIGIRGVGTITIIQRIVGSDTSVAFTSSLASLTRSIATSNGSGQLVATSVPAGSHSISAADLSASGYALTDISCNDSDSAVSLANRTVAMALSPNEDLVCTFTSANSREAATTAINNFLTGRNALILSHQPDLQRRIDRLQVQPSSGGSASAYGVPVPGSGKLPFNMTLANGRSLLKSSLAMVGAATGDPDRGKQPFDIWAEAYFSRATIGGQRGNFRIIYTGADYRLGDNVLLGALAEFDDFSNNGALAAGEAEGNGWMVGPYAMARLAPNLYGEIRAAWGKSDNRVSPLGTFVDDFKTSRSFYSGSLIGQFDIGQRTDFRPELTVRHLGEKVNGYTDSLNIAIPGQTVSQGDISFRPRIQHLVEFDSGWSIRPFGEIEGIYTFGTNANSVLDNGVRARIEGGIDLFSSGGLRASLSGFHDGIGSSNYHSTGAHVSVSFGF